jgi:photosystem II stability/assembly factor-like uncharacterized protein
MKKLAVILALFLANVSNILGQGWLPCVSNTSRSLYDVEVVSSDIAYSITSKFLSQMDSFPTEWDYNEILQKTVNGGITWDSIATIPIWANKIHFLNENVGYAFGGELGCGLYPTVLKTEDGGHTWNSISAPPTLSYYLDGYFENENKGIMFTAGNEIVQQEIQNSGDTIWTVTSSVQSQGHAGSYFHNQNEGYIIGNSTYLRYIYKTVDGGLSWDTCFFNTECFADIQFASHSVGYVAAHSQLLKTIDGGITWNFIPLSFEAIRLAFYSDAIGFAIGTNGDIYKTIDGGENWQLSYEGEFRAIDIKDGLVIAVGLNGSIIRFSFTEPAVLGNHNENELSYSINVYPNPNSEVLHIAVKNKEIINTEKAM